MNEVEREVILILSKKERVKCMRNKKRMIAALLTAAMVFGITGCGAKSSSGEAGSTENASKDSGTYDQVVYAYSTFNNIPSEKDLGEVEEAINKITREKIGTEVTLKPIAIADYSSKVSLALQGGEKIDVFQSLGDFNNCVAQDMTYDLTDLLEKEGKATKELVGDQWLAACSTDGKIYGVPTMKPVALTPMFVYRQDLADELGIDISGVNSPEDVTAVLKQVKEAYPDMTPLAPVQQGTIGLNLTFEKTDYLTDDYYKPIGVLQGDNTDVIDLYSSEEFKNAAKLARTWYDEGLVMKDAATTTSTSQECLASGNYFGFIAAYSYPEADTAANLQSQCGGYELGAKKIGDSYLSTGDINAVSWMIASTTDVPEAAMKFLDLTYTDEDVINLLIYGIEGRDYVKNDDGTVSYPEGEDATTVPYTAQLSCGTLGNFFKMFPMEGTDPASIEWELEQNKTAKTSPAMGFTFDSKKLKTQYTAVGNVISQYLPGLLCGSLDPDTGIEKFVNALNDAGYQDILAAKQEQLDAWMAQK